MVKNIENTTVYNRLISDENIYLAIYSLDSYIFNKELLSIDDKKLLNQLRDKFDESKIRDVIYDVRAVLKELVLDKNRFIEAMVYFKPKKYDKDNRKMIFRPLHTTSIIYQIASVSILNMFVYEPNDGDDELTLSNISRLIPENFYGNRVSTRPEVLFKPWKTQYKTYSQKANDLFKNYHETHEYNFEVDLDLKNFFPSVSIPMVYNQVLHLLPVNLSEEEEIVYKILLIKLLTCKVVNLDENTCELYYENSWRENQTNFALGIAQGLPQSYFLGNICMIEIAKIFEKNFPGKSLFYVDDSVIFCNDIKSDEDFQRRLDNINVEIKKLVSEENQNIDDFFRMYNDELINFIRDHEQTIEVYGMNEKSTYSNIRKANHGEIYLRSISREVSQIGMDFYSNYSDSEEENLAQKMSVLMEAVSKEIIRVKKELDEEIFNTSKENVEAYLKKLPRYYKFFKYRKLKMEVQTKNKGLSISDASILVPVDDKDFLEKFAEVFKQDIWSAYISLGIRSLGEKEVKWLKKYIKQVNEKLFKSQNAKSSYIAAAFSEFINNKESDEKPQNPYESLEKLIYKMFSKYRQVNGTALESILNEVLEYQWEKLLSDTRIFSEEFLKQIRIVDRNTSEMKRMVLNAIYSYLFNVQMNDQMILTKNSRKPLIYGELRVLALIRNTLFDKNIYQKIPEIWKDEENLLKMDYAILEVLDVFRSYVRSPMQIDHLIKIHQYTCDVWKNGSKYLYFYTLHNQEHAIDLIKNIVKLIKAIDYLQISSTDFYIVFVACYLHDISMVKIPSSELFLLDNEKSDEISTEYLERVRQEDNRDVKEVKKMLLDFYKKIDIFYENQIRGTHASESAKEIRKRGDLKFLEECLREKVAEIAFAHGQSTDDIYKAKSNAKNSLISTKFDKILLRLADVLDMSNYRVSKPILNHNVDQMSEMSAFHWISHLMTKGYTLQTEYTILDGGRSVLESKRIEEKLIFKIDVEISQLSQVKNEKGCRYGKLDRETISDKGFTIRCAESCDGHNCNFLCKWFMKKNEYLIEELAALKSYLNRTPDNYFKTDIEVKICIVNKTKVDARQFEILNANI